jgi:hypothetical protein
MLALDLRRKFCARTHRDLMTHTTITSGMDSTWQVCRLISRRLGVAVTSSGPSRVSSDVPRSSGAKEKSSSSQEGYAGETGQKWLPFIVFRRGCSASSCMPPAARVPYTLFAQSVEPSGPSLPGRGLRAARFPGVMIISAAQQRPLRLERDERDTQCKCSSFGTGSRLWRYPCLRRAVRDQARDHGVD